jgi:hypothetical protein
MELRHLHHGRSTECFQGLLPAFLERFTEIRLGISDRNIAGVVNTLRIGDRLCLGVNANL